MSSTDAPADIGWIPLDDGLFNHVNAQNKVSCQIPLRQADTIIHIPYRHKSFSIYYFILLQVKCNKFI